MEVEGLEGVQGVAEAQGAAGGWVPGLSAGVRGDRAAPPALAGLCRLVGTQRGAGRMRCSSLEGRARAVGQRGRRGWGRRLVFHVRLLRLRWGLVGVVLRLGDWRLRGRQLE